MTLERPCVHTDLTLGNLNNVNMLDWVELPDMSRYSIPAYYLTRATGCTPGAVKVLELPTLGRIEWTYQYYLFPNPPGSRLHRTRSNGVATRTLYGASGPEVGHWTYNTALNDVGALEDVELVNTVTTPLGHKTEHYFSTSLDVIGTPWNIHEYGLPLTHSVPDATGTRFLSTREKGNADLVLRSSYVAYERDAGTGQLVTEATKFNQRLSSTRTVYEDDPVGAPEEGMRFAETTSSNFDGLGHYRTTQTGGNFAAGNFRTSYTRHNDNRGTYPGAFSMWPLNEPWVLETFDLSDETEGAVTARRTFEFDLTNGWLKRMRTHAAGTGTATQDLVVERLHNAGNLTKESFYGGDIQGVGLEPVKDLILTSPQYRIDYTSQWGAQATATYFKADGTAMTFKSLDQTIDSSTGLPSSSRDTSEISTSYEYDLMGRLLLVKPEIGNHDGWTEYAYTRATSASTLAQVNVYRLPNGGGGTKPLPDAEYKYDAFGRPSQAHQRMANGNMSIRETFYNAIGWKTSVSELGDIGKTTKYLSYDPFGRPGTVRPPDGANHEISFVYVGVRQVARSVPVGNTFNGAQIVEVPAWKTEIYDRQGRLYRVREEADWDLTNTPPNPPVPANTTTTYTYDVGNRLVRVQQSNFSGTTTQNRFFTYDQRGFLLKEQHPEKGDPATGNGLVIYSDYDARGHVGRRYECSTVACIATPTLRAAELTFGYDRAERRLSVTEVVNNTPPAPPTLKALKAFVYGTSNAAGVRTNGRLQSATRYNYPLGLTIQAAESYLYGGRQGRVSQKTTLHIFNGVNKESFVQSYVYNLLGSVSHIDYPKCTYVPSCTSQPIAGGIDFTYANGMLTAVPLYATSISYHPNGLVNQVTHANSVVDTQANDPNGMGRPAALTAVRLGATLWNSGTYAYDGAGNIDRIGSGYFLYDHVSRLVDGHIDDSRTGGGTLRSQTYEYDPFGNRIDMHGDSWAAGRSTPTSQTTNRLNAATFDVPGNLRTWNATPTSTMLSAC